MTSGRSFRGPELRYLHKDEAITALPTSPGLWNNSSEYMMHSQACYELYKVEGQRSVLSRSWAQCSLFSPAVSVGLGSWSIISLMPTASQERSRSRHLAPPSACSTPTHLVLKSSAASLALSICTTSLLFSDLMHRIWGKKVGLVIHYLQSHQWPQVKRSSIGLRFKRQHALGQHKLPKT